MKTLLLSLCAGLAGLTLLSAAEPKGVPTEAPATPLFDGKTFRGWEGDTNHTFRIEQGAIVGGSLTNRVPRNEFLCTTRPYTNFVLKLQFKLVGAGANAGVQFRTKRIPNNHEVSGYQADMGEPNWWGSLYDESRRNTVLAWSPIEEVKKTLKPEGWNDYVIRAEGNHIQLFLNGLKTVDYLEEDKSAENFGIIAVQIHGGPPSEAWYRNITVQELP